MPARPGKDVKIQHGKGTILSEDGTELTAEINGQVTFKAGRISVEPIYVVNGDVSLETGNIVFLGSVIIAGSVQDNFEVKAAGNIEVRGTVQKAFLEAEGDIIVFQGITGRERGEDRIDRRVRVRQVHTERLRLCRDTTSSSPRASCIPMSTREAGSAATASARVSSAALSARATRSTRGSSATDVSTKTEIRVGIHPKVLQQLSDLTGMKAKIEEEQTQLKLNLRTLETQKRNAGNKLPAEKEKLLKDLQARNAKLNERTEEIKGELEEVNSYINMIEHKGKVCAERTAFGGVEIYIKDKTFILKDPYNHVKFSLQGDQIRISEYEPPRGN